MQLPLFPQARGPLDNGPLCDLFASGLVRGSVLREPRLERAPRVGFFEKVPLGNAFWKCLTANSRLVANGTQGPAPRRSPVLRGPVLTVATPGLPWVRTVDRRTAPRTVRAPRAQTCPKRGTATGPDHRGHRFPPGRKLGSRSTWGSSTPFPQGLFPQGLFPQGRWTLPALKRGR